jgi:uncharacterized protein YigA (DUF484 family)
MTSWEIRRLAERLGMPEPSAVTVALVRAAVAVERDRAHRIAATYAEHDAIANTIATKIRSAK